MFTNNYRIKKQWAEINSSIRQRNDYVPYAFGRKMIITVNETGEEFKIYSKRDFFKKKEYISKKYGYDDMVDININFIIDFNDLFRRTEKKTRKLLGIQDNKITKVRVK